MSYHMPLDVCLIKGQIRKECASHPDCAKTCSNTGELLACSERCIPNGCECPDGTVIDVDKNECVELGECPGMCISYIISNHIIIVWHLASYTGSKIRY